MKIIVFGNVRSSDSFSKNIYTTLEKQGHEVLPIEPSANFLRRPFARAITHYAMRLSPMMEQWNYASLLKKASVVQPDLILVAEGGQGPPPSVIRNLKQQTSAKVVMWFSDHMANFGRQYLMAAEYDAYFFKDRYIVELFRDKLGKNVHFLQEACNPLWHKRVVLTEEDRAIYGCDLTTTANMYYYRSLICENYLDYDFKIWGSVPRWLESPIRSAYQGRPVGEHEKAKAFNAAKIVLNPMFYAEVLGVNNRLWEAAGCGAFQLVDWKPNIAESFEPGKEIVTFRTLVELKEQVAYYLAHDQERQDIADRAYERAHREHTYENRLKDLLDLTFN